MKKVQKHFSEIQKCGHCTNSAPMEIVSEYSNLKSRDDPKSGFSWEEGDIFELLKCPACENLILRSYYWHDEAMDPSDVIYEVLYPVTEACPEGLPEIIKNAYIAANKVRAIDPNAYAVLIGRLLELICADRNATGRTLSDRIADLSNKGEIPDKLVGIANTLRILRNIGAHAMLGALTMDEIPILDKLCRAILEYVYSGPFMVEQVEKRVKSLKRPAIPNYKMKGTKEAASRTFRHK